MQNFFFSLFTAQHAQQPVDAAVVSARPVELGMTELQQVAGGFGPAGTWVVATPVTEGPAGTW